ncbi:hypothetical protein HanXRQr2_Chr02g0069891 [Helianthus annuus]|uniref:Uncharacterized protein n=1 Tax=Helianthus annuus TaxID=4232 RepID=A0A251VHL7_HELAN|nr:hypothetical protein HanXRQr2_Chr02g0069891 [Helianthus annuus]KAJ0605009.1 hypothetical protein HanHA300_Chr02g0058141 [Helianthus annuus]KAJ0619023.1 hypothetical protein HanHA89_Chr02g0066631 [Helianthus annuus]KAJ0777477.1 hypothetical protein HanLR1_Chr02g0060901 [Helianthus annuus]KAJ0952078.1 hypothetical protein HanPSC8_Chr02g0067901 [Helianthus annuus]
MKLWNTKYFYFLYVSYPFLPLVNSGTQCKRMKQHLADIGDVPECKKVTEAVRKPMLKNLDDAESRSKVGGDGDYDDSKKELGFAIGRFFIDA